MTELRIAQDLVLPADAVTQTFAILAKRGAGKTYTAAVVTEELLKAGQHVAVVDPVGVWWGLRAAADGKGPGLPIVVLGGDHGDLPLLETSGELIADLVVDEALSVVLDLSLLRKGEQTRFMTDFAERLYHRNRQPLHLVLDEADAFAPQRPLPGQQRLLGAVEDLVRRGRARGLGITLVTQRAAVLNKDVLTQVEVLVALRTIAPQDRDAIDAWIRVHGTPEQREQLMTSLPSLPIGTAWVWSPGWLDLFQRIQVRRRETFDSSATPTVGAVVPQPKALASVDLESLRQRLGAAIEKAKADDPKELRRQLAAVRQELASIVATNKTLERVAQKPREAERVVERVEVSVLDEAQLQRLQDVADSLSAAAMRVIDAAGEIRSALVQVRGSMSAAAAAAPVAPRTRAPAPVRSIATPRAIQSGDLGELKLRKGERTMLAVLGRHARFKLTRAQLATLSGYTASGGTFGTYFMTLRRYELLTDTGGEVQITAKGLTFLGIEELPAPQTTEEVLDQWRAALRKGERVMMDELVSVYPMALQRGELARRTGYEVSGGTFGTYLGTLRRNGLADVEGDQVRASDTLFLSEVPR